MSTYNELIRIFAGMDDETTMARLFSEIFTEKERRDLALRWELLKDLHTGQTQRNIAAKHKISLCKITRGSKILKDPDSVIGALLEKNYGNSKKNNSIMPVTPGNTP